MSTLHATSANVKIGCQVVPVQQRSYCVRCKWVCRDTELSCCQMGVSHAVGGTGGKRVSCVHSQLLVWFFCRAVKNEAALRSSCCVRLMLLMEVVPATVTKKSKTSKWHIEGLAVLVLKINTHAAPTPQKVVKLNFFFCFGCFFHFCSNTLISRQCFAYKEPAFTF